VLNMKAGNIVLEGEKAYYTYRGKVANRGQRATPAGAKRDKSPAGAFGKDLSTMPADESLWPTLSHHSKKASPAGTFYATCRSILKRQTLRRLECISSGIQLPSCAATLEKPWRMSVGFWTTVV